MAVAIKLKRIGKTLKPVYRVIVIHSKKRCQGTPIEELGHYNPRNKKDISLNIERINYWIKTGAIVSDTVKNLLKKQTEIQKNI
ncbi:MAG: 30S ribosomal protein S16 [Elusimicrobia bacterium RIFOXYC2_FULL_34_12]|nr:MAG: 30S ribosomal protein S16 [Elusimicrobia bacterium RIFOXYC2_FULL_34_12]OGS39024.1 MAG: 30S ribosomal protein S16 [Elusimicrobia bacterium RIFOXYD2_FULL_34_30]HAM39687.1 30S ribosomal protein S16 [Elusimicrobiota bacterium]